MGFFSNLFGKTEIPDIDFNTATIIDVRTSQEYKQGNIPKSINIPVDVIGKQIEAKVKDKNKNIIVYCASGSRSRYASKVIKNFGYTNVYDFGGFYSAKSKMGL